MFLKYVPTFPNAYSLQVIADEYWEIIGRLVDTNVKFMYLF